MLSRPEMETLTPKCTTGYVVDRYATARRFDDYHDNVFALRRFGDLDIQRRTVYCSPDSPLYWRSIPSPKILPSYFKTGQSSPLIAELALYYMY